MFPIFALFAGLPLGDIPVAIPAPPIVLPVIAPANQALGIIVIAIIAPPPVLFGAAPAGVALGGVPPVGWIVALPATFHVVACGVAVVAGLSALLWQLSQGCSFLTDLLQFRQFQFIGPSYAICYKWTFNQRICSLRHR
jgi:hypothetical protein